MKNIYWAFRGSDVIDDLVVLVCEQTVLACAPLNVRLFRLGEMTEQFCQGDAKRSMEYRETVLVRDLFEKKESGGRHGVDGRDGIGGRRILFSLGKRTAAMFLR
jgi:hypothetical protein